MKIVNEKTSNLAQKLKDKMTQNQKQQKQRQYQEENAEAEAEQKQLRKILSKISGLKNRKDEREKQIEKQKIEKNQKKLKKDKYQLQCDIMKQMIKQEQEQYEMYRNFDFAYVTKAYKLTEETKTFQPPLSIKNQLSSSLALSRQGVQISNIQTIKQEHKRRDSRLISQYIQEDVATPRRSAFGNKSPLQTNKNFLNTSMNA